MTADGLDWAALLPHQGAMRLLDSVVEFDADRIVCLADPRRANHPLARQGRVSSVHVIEYAAQAAALHQALTHRPGPTARAGWLLQVREGVFDVGRLDTLTAPLTIEATRFIGGSNLARYRYSVCSAADAVGSGELTLMLGTR